MMGAISAVIVNIASLGGLAVRHDPYMLRMIAVRAGLDGALVSPFFAIIPGTVEAIVGGAVDKLLARALQRNRA